MCGIAGFVDYKRNKDITACISDMTDTLIHRGPDDFGILTKNNISLGHRRLSILDLSSLGHQPMISDCQKYSIVFNGEIYNFKELRTSLIKLGHSFKSESDTEVILLGFKEWGIDLFIKLNGIFAFAIYDEINEEIYIVRDRLGVKPLYYYANDNEFYFASEIKAITKVCPEINKISYQGLSSFLYYGNSIGQQTLYQDIKSIDPGKFIKIKDHQYTISTYWNPDKIIERVNITLEESVVSVTKHLEDAVKRQLVSDVPVGVFLSGGIDSTAITAFATKHYTGKLQTFSAAFDFDKGVNELDKAKYISDYYGTEHTELFIKGADLPDIVEKMIFHHDEPFSDAANIPLYLMATDVKKHATVVLQGDGGDELFGGYNRYFLMEKYGHGLKRNLFKVFSSIIGSLDYSLINFDRSARIINALGQKEEAMIMALLLTTDTLQKNTKQLLSAKIQQSLDSYDPFAHYRITDDRFKDKSLLQRMFYVDTQIILPNTFLEKVDKSTMAASIEVRVPFLDNQLVEFVMSLPAHIKLFNGEKKFLLKKALRGIVPDRVLDGPKTGFGVPYENWLKGPLYEFMNDKLRTNYIKNLDLFDYKLLDKRIKDHKEGISNYGFQLWKLMNLSIWLEKNKISIV